MRLLVLACAALLWAVVAPAQNPQIRGTYVTGDQLAPSTAFFDSVVTVGSASDDSVYFGFFADWFEIIPYNSDLVWNITHDPLLDPANAAAGADSSRTLQITSSRGAAGSVALVSLTQSLLDVSLMSKVSLGVRCSGIRLQGTATDSVLVLAGGGATLNVRY